MSVSPAQQRIDTAMALGKPDRVPVAPMLDNFAATYARVSQHDMLFNIRRADEAFMKVHSDLGPIDGFHQSNAGLADLITAMAMVPPVLPGVNGVDKNALWQFVERTIMEPDEYGALAADPRVFFMEKAIEYNPVITGPFTFRYWQLRGQFAFLRVQMSARSWRRRGVEPIVAGNNCFFPMEFITLGLRSCTDFVTDLFRYPNELQTACRSMMKADRLRWLAGPFTSGIKRALIGLTRTSATIMSPKQFQKFALDDLREMCEFLISHRITPILHMDNEWTPFFPMFKEFPRGKCVCNLDGTSDIFAAKEILGDTMCIMGDVPATLLTLGEPDEVDAYCERLIKEVGAGGGFILSSGCDTPVDAKVENVKAMLTSVQRHRP
jgi:hypothetical protein